MNTHYYLEAYKHILNLLMQLGSTLAPAVKSLQECLEAMDFHLMSNRGVNYEFVERMIRYELKFKLIQKKVVLLRLLKLKFGSTSNENNNEHC